MDHMQHGGQQLSKNANFARVFRALSAARRPMPVSELTKVCGLSSPTLSRILKRMQQMSLVLEHSKQTAKAGRNRSLYVLNPAYLSTMDIFIDKDQVRFSIDDFVGNALLARSFPVTPRLRETDVLDWLCGQIQLMVHERFGDDDMVRHLYSINVVVSGRVHAEGDRTYVTVGGVFAGRDTEIRQFLQRRTGVRTFIEKDTVACLLRASQMPQAEGIRHMMFFRIDVGLGSAVMLDGSVHRGLNDYAGELGSMSAGLVPIAKLSAPPEVDPNERLSFTEWNYGLATIKQKAYDIYLAGRGMLRDRIERSGLKVEKPSDIALSLIDGAALDGDADMICLLYEPIMVWSSMMINACCLIAPEAIAVGGQVNCSTPYIMNRIRQTVAASIDCGVQIFAADNGAFASKAVGDFALANTYREKELEFLDQTDD